MARVWSRIGDRARAEDTPVSVAHVCQACAEAVGAVGAGLSMASGSGLKEPVYATDGRSAELAELQFTLGEGPCMEALARDEAVLVEDLTMPEFALRWPVFAPAAAAMGMRGMFSVPVRAGAVRIGVLDLYRERSGTLTRDELLDVLAYTDVLLVLALDRGGILPDMEQLLDEEFAERRASVHQAAGMVKVQLGIEVGEALSVLRAHAFATERRLAAVADDVLARKLWFDAETGEAVTSPPQDNSTDLEGAG